MARPETVDDLVELLEVDRRVDRAVVHLQLVPERLEQELVIEEVGVRQDQMRVRRQVLVQVVQPVDGVAEAQRLVRAD